MPADGPVTALPPAALQARAVLAERGPLDPVELQAALRSRGTVVNLDLLHRFGERFADHFAVDAEGRLALPEQVDHASSGDTEVTDDPSAAQSCWWAEPAPLDPLAPRDVVVLDIETTGLDREQDHVWQLAAVRLDGSAELVLEVDHEGGTRDPQGRELVPLPEALDRLERFLSAAGAGVLDFHDVVLRALEHARALEEPRYRAAIVDEAQDLTLAGLQLLRALVNGPSRHDRPDGLLIVGDGAQRIYPGGFTLRQAGVEVRGRTTVLRTNYRNTREIIAAAMAVAGSDEVDDLGEAYARGEAEAGAERGGTRPVLVGCEGHLDELRWITEQIRELKGSDTLAYGDIAVCTATNKQADTIVEHFTRLAIPSVRLQHYDGTPIDKVKVGTHFRAKGLEFKVVFLPFLGARDFPRKPFPGQPPEEVAEQQSLALSQLFVAMTRARDALFLLASGNPSPLLGTLDHFHVVDS